MQEAASGNGNPFKALEAVPLRVPRLVSMTPECDGSCPLSGQELFILGRISFLAMFSHDGTEVSATPFFIGSPCGMNRHRTCAIIRQLASKKYITIEYAPNARCSGDAARWRISLNLSNPDYILSEDYLKVFGEPSHETEETGEDADPSEDTDDASHETLNPGKRSESDRLEKSGSGQKVTASGSENERLEVRKCTLSGQKVTASGSENERLEVRNCPLNKEYKDTYTDIKTLKVDNSPTPPKVNDQNQNRSYQTDIFSGSGFQNDDVSAKSYRLDPKMPPDLQSLSDEMEKNLSIARSHGSEVAYRIIPMIEARQCWAKYNSTGWPPVSWRSTAMTWINHKISWTENDMYGRLFKLEDKRKTITDRCAMTYKAALDSEMQHREKTGSAVLETGDYDDYR